MAVGDTKADTQSILTGARLTIQPPAGEEWIIHNIYREANVTVERFDGTLNTPFNVLTGAGFLSGYFRVTNSDYIRVLNNDALTKNISYDGVQVK